MKLQAVELQKLSTRSRFPMILHDTAILLNDKPARDHTAISQWNCRYILQSGLQWSYWVYIARVLVDCGFQRLIDRR